MNIAYENAAAGHSTVLWDMDPQASASWYLGVDETKPATKAIRLLRQKTTLGKLRLHTPYKKLTLIPADNSLRKQELIFAQEDTSRKLLAKMVATLGETQATVIFDCAPSLSATANNIFNAVDVLLVPLLPSPLSIRAYEQVLDYLDQKRWKKLKVFPFLTMVDRRRKLHNEILDNRKKLFDNVLDTYIPYTSVAEKMGVHRQPLGVFASSSPTTLAYRSLLKELRKKIT